MKKILLFLLLPILAFGQAVYTKPYDNMVSGDLVVTNVSTSGLMTNNSFKINGTPVGTGSNVTITVGSSAFATNSASATNAIVVTGAQSNLINVAQTNWVGPLASGLTAGSNYAVQVANNASNGAISVMSASMLTQKVGSATTVTGGQSNTIVLLTSHAIAQTNINNAVSAGMGALTTAVVAANTTGATHTTSIAALSSTQVVLKANAVAQTNINNSVAQGMGSLTTSVVAANTTGATHTTSIAALFATQEVLKAHAAAQTNVNTAVAAGLLSLTNAVNAAVTNRGVTVAAGANITLNGGSSTVVLTNGITLTIASTATGGGGSWISNVVITGLNAYRTGVVVNFTSTVPLTAWDIGAVSNNGITINGITIGNGTNLTITSGSGDSSFATNSYYATNAGNAYAVNGLTSTQIMAQATNSFALRSWVLGFSNAPATYNSADATLDVAMPDGTTGQMFEELWMPIKNTAGVPLTNGVCVRVEDASGALSGVRLVACTDTWDQVLGTIGLSTMTTTTPINSDGKITTFGNVNDLDTTMFIEGSNLWLSSTPGQLTMAKPTAAGCKQILIGKCLRSHANQGRISVGVRIIPRPDDIGAVATNDARYLATLTNGGPVALAAITATNVFAITEDPSGFAGETDNTRTYSFNPTTRVLTVSGASTVYRDGQVLSNFTTCAWPAIGTNAGIWYLSWKHGTSIATATQTVSQTEWALDDIQQATVYWSGGTATVSTIPTFIIGEETHGFMPWTVHRRFHLTDGSKWASGLSFSGSAKVFTNSSGVWLDEDIAHQVAQTSSSRVMWRSAGLSTPVFGTPGTQYVITNGLGGADLMYDSSGTLTTVPANNYVNYWIYVVPGSISDYLVVVGRTVSSTLATITAETPYDLTGLQPFVESVLLYRVTLRNANPPVVTQTTDYRKSGTTGVSYSPTAHATLTGRDAVDSHPLAAITGWENLLTNGGPVAVAATNAQTQVTNHIAQTLSVGAHGGMPSLVSVLSAGNNAAGISITNFLDIQGTGRSVIGFGLYANNINATAVGSAQYGWSDQGVVTIGSESVGASQHGYFESGTMAIGTGCSGSSQHGYNGGTMYVGDGAVGACQRGVVVAGAFATNNGRGAVQLVDLEAGETAITTAGGKSSLLLGPGTASNKNCIVAGSGQASHGDGSITAGGGFYGPGAGLTGVPAADAANSTGATHTAQIATNAANITSNASPYQPWTQVMGTPTNLGTTVMSFTNGALPLLACTGAQTVAWIDGNANGWGTAGVNRQRLALWKGGWSVTIQSNASVVHASTITLSSTKTNHIVANITVGNGYTNVVLYPLTAQ